MKVFISWSGPLSERIATILREWLPDVLQQVEPFMSTEDIRKGNRWQSEIAEQLNETRYGIACLTVGNLSSEWLLFETGALSKVLENSMTWTLLIGDLEQAQVSGPLAQFQHTSLNKRADFKRLVEDINATLEPPLPQDRLSRIFDRCWEELDHKVETATNQITENEVEKPARPDEELLSELIDISRANSRKLARLDTTTETKTKESTSEASFRTLDLSFSVSTRVISLESLESKLDDFADRWRGFYTVSDDSNTSEVAVRMSKSYAKLFSRDGGGRKVQEITRRLCNDGIPVGALEFSVK